MKEKIFLYLDESGNLGSDGRYFTIAAIETTNSKPLNNVMKKSILKTKKTFERYKDKTEIKASESTSIIKDYFLRKIASKQNISLRYAISDKIHVKQELLEDENLLYNYMLNFIIVPVAKKKGLETLVIILDKRSIKVKSGNSFEDYINIKLRYEMILDITIVVKYIESHNSYAVQAADFVANAINNKYEYESEYNFNLIQSKIVHTTLFPYSKFGN